MSIRELDDFGDLKMTEISPSDQDVAPGASSSSPGDFGLNSGVEGVADLSPVPTQQREYHDAESLLNFFVKLELPPRSLARFFEFCL